MLRLLGALHITQLPPDECQVAVNKLFAEADANGDGLLDKHELYNYLCEIKVAASHHVVERFFHLHNIIKTTLTHTELAEAVAQVQAWSFGVPARPRMAPTSSNRSVAKTPTLTSQLSALSQPLAAHAAKRSSLLSAHELDRLQQVLAELDPLGSGKVSYEAYTKRLQDFMWELRPWAASVCRSLDKGGRGELRYKDIIGTLFPYASDSQIGELVHILLASSRRAHRIGGSKTGDAVNSGALLGAAIVSAGQGTQAAIKALRSALAAFDVGTDGKMPTDVFTDAMLTAGFSRRETRLIVLSVDPQQQGVVEVDAFIDWYLYSQVGADLRRRKSQQLRGSRAGSQANGPTQ